MTLPFLTHSLFLIAAVVLTFYWVKDPTLSLYTLQLVAVFVLLYFLNNWLHRRTGESKPTGGLIPSLVFTMVVLLLVMSTGGLTSPLFFLVYFLLFGLSLTLEPAVTITLALSLIIFFFFSSPNISIANIIPILSLILITPLSLFFGRQYLKVLNQKGEIKILKSKEQKAKRDIIVEESNVLLWLNLNFKHGMLTIIDRISRVLEKPLTLTQKEALTKALRICQQLYQTGKILEEKIDKQTDENQVMSN